MNRIVDAKDGSRVLLIEAPEIQHAIILTARRDDDGEWRVNGLVAFQSEEAADVGEKLGVIARRTRGPTA
jgi:hypothetical protein